MNNYCVDLEFNFSLLKDNYDPFSAPMGHSKLDNQYVSDEFCQYIDSLGLKLLYIEIFVKGPNYGPGVHVDHGKKDMAKLNWVYGGEDSTMTWYAPKKGRLPKFNTTAINSYSVTYEEDDVELVHSQRVGFPSLVQSGVPHGIYTKEQPRYCYSAVLFSKDNIRLPFKQMLELFKDYIKQ
jgi:hypothetical protein